MLTVGNEVVRQLLRQMTDGEQIMFLQKVLHGYQGEGDPPPRRILDLIKSGELRIVLEDATIKLVDQNGHFIPLKGMKTVNANRVFHYVQPEISYPDIHDRLVTHFPKGTNFVSKEEFEMQGAALIAEAKTDKQMNNLFRGLYLPICLPQITDGDYGQILEDIFLGAASSSYQQAFPKREFSNWRKGELANKVMVVDDRHQDLVERMHQGSVVGLYFADAFRGFGIEDDRKMARELPKGYSLSGGFDATVAFTADPKTMARDSNTPTTDCAALSWQSGEFSLCFGPGDGLLSFVLRRLDALGDCSVGLLFTK